MYSWNREKLNIIGKFKLKKGLQQQYLRQVEIFVSLFLFFYLFLLEYSL